MEDCPQSWKPGYTFLDKPAPHQASFTEILSIGGKKKVLHSFSESSGVKVTGTFRKGKTVPLSSWEDVREELSFVFREERGRE